MLKVGDFVEIEEHGILYRLLVIKIVPDPYYGVKYYYKDLKGNISLLEEDHYFHIYEDLKISVLYNFFEEMNSII